MLGTSRGGLSAVSDDAGFFLRDATLAPGTAFPLGAALRLDGPAGVGEAGEAGEAGEVIGRPSPAALWAPRLA